MPLDLMRDELDTGGSGRPGELGLVLRVNPATGQRQMDKLSWGLLPHDTRDPASAPRATHARAETVTTKPMFADAFRHRRAIVPADAFSSATRRESTAGGTSPSRAATEARSASQASGRATTGRMAV